MGHHIHPKPELPLRGFGLPGTTGSPSPKDLVGVGGRPRVEVTGNRVYDSLLAIGGGDSEVESFSTGTSGPEPPLPVYACSG